MLKHSSHLKQQKLRMSLLLEANRSQTGNTF